MAALRTGAAGAAAGALLILLMAGVRAPSPNSPGLFHGLAIAAFGLALAGGGLLAADAISSERREGSLGLLFLADVGGLGVVLGKLASRGLSAALALGAVLPILALSWMAGGVTPDEFVRTTLALGNTLFLSLAIALWVSSRRIKQGAATAETALWLLFLVALGGVYRVLLRHPGTAGFRWWFGVSPWVLLRCARDPVIGGDPVVFWSSLWLDHAASWLALAGAAWSARRYRDPVIVGSRRAGCEVAIGGDRRSVTIRRPAPRMTAEGLDANPIEAALGLQRGPQAAAWAIAIVGILARWGADGICLLHREWLGLGLGPMDYAKAPSMQMALVALNAVEMTALTGFAAVAAAHVCAFINTTREDGSLELLLTTNLADREVFAGLWRSLRAMFGGPLTAWLALSFAAPVIAFAQWTATRGAPLDAWATHWFELALGMPLRVWAAGAFAAWASLGPIRPASALRTTLFWAVLLPGLGAALNPYLGSAVVLGFAQNKLRQPVRSLLELRPS